MQNEVIAALPNGLRADSPELRKFLINRVIYVFTPTDNPTTFFALDPVSGALPQGLAFNAKIFWLDPSDSSSAHDGVAVIRTADDYRYKVNPVDSRSLSVINFTTTTPPVSPALGDTYLVPAGATGAWSSKQDDIAKWTRNGWDFEIPRIGRWVLDETVKGYLSYGSTGWAYGPGARSFDAASIPFSAALGWGARFEVEDQTTTVPPTATKGLRYVVGPSATLGWNGKDKQVAICEVAGQWTFYPASDGWIIFDKTQQSDFRWSAATSTWVSAAGSWIARQSMQTVSGSTTAPTGTAAYSYSSGTAPTTSQRRTIDTVTISHTAKKAGAVLRFEYSAAATFAKPGGGFTGATGPVTIAIYRDIVASALDWRPVAFVREVMDLAGGTPTLGIQIQFEIAAPDTGAHTYRIAIHSVGVSNDPIDCTALTRRLFTVQEAA